MLNQVFICWKFLLLMVADSTGLAPVVTPPLLATTNFAFTASYW